MNCEIHRFLAIFLVASIWSCTIARSEETKTQLPRDFTDFAIEPESGTIGAISAETSEVFLIQAADQIKGTASVFSKVLVGGRPCSIVYKKYQEMSLFIVVCLDDPFMYMLDVSAERTRTSSFKISHRVSLDGNDARAVTASVNQQDPFVYYTLRDRNIARVGVVSLREMQTNSLIQSAATDVAISASGALLLMRQDTSVRESYRISNVLTDKSPQFDRILRTKLPTENFATDPFDRFTAVGKEVYTSGLETKESTLDFVPLCFLNAKPIVAGILDLQPILPGAEVSVSRSLEVRLASSNTFKKIGVPVSIQHENASNERYLIASKQNPPDRVEKRLRMLLDERREAIVVAEGNTMHRIPFEDLKLVDEPFVSATLTSPRCVFCNQVNKFEIVPSDPRVEIEVVQSPEGMEVVGNKLVWRPTPNQIGVSIVRIALKSGVLRRKQSFKVHVEFPNLQIPFAATSCVVDEDQNQAVICDSIPISHERREEASSTSSRIAVLNLDTMSVIRERTIPGLVGAILETKDHLFCLPLVYGGNKCQVLRRNDLRVCASLELKGAISQFDIIGTNIVIQSDEELVTFDRSTLKQTHRFTRNPSYGTDTRLHSWVSKNGIFAQGVVFDYDMRPKLLISLWKFIGSESEANERFLQFARKSISYQTYSEMVQRRFSNFDPYQLQKQSIPNSNIQLQLEQQFVGARDNVVEQRMRLILTATGRVNEKQILLENGPVRPIDQSRKSPTLLCAASKYALVFHDGKMYRWNVPESDEIEEDKAVAKLPSIADLRDIENESTELPSDFDPFQKPRFIPSQSSITLSMDSSTVLYHSVVGGKPPYRFTLPKGILAMEIDQSTGAIELNNSQVLAQALKKLEREFFFVGNDALIYMDNVKSFAENVLGRVPVGIPVAIPIELSVTDAAEKSDTLRYQMIVEVPQEKLDTSR